MNTVIQFGAGNIGRGFLGQLFSQSGWQTTFIDVNPILVDLIQERKEYTIKIVGPGAREVPVNHIDAINGKDLQAVAEAIRDANLIGTAVGVGALPFIAPALARGLELRAQKNLGIDIVICENMLDAGEHLRNLLRERMRPQYHEFLDNNVGMVETVVSRMIPPPTQAMQAEDPLAIAVEAYGILPCSKQGFKNGIPQIQGFELTDKIHAYEERKLFAHNCAHALASYFGWQNGLTYTREVMENPTLRQKVWDGAWESGRALCQKHGFTEEEHTAHLEDLFTRFANEALGDTTVRCGRDPIRKLGRRDRLVGAALLAMEYDQEPTILAEGICAALRFQPEGDPNAKQLQAQLREEGINHVLTDVCQLTPNEPLYQKILQTWSA